MRRHRIRDHQIVEAGHVPEAFGLRGCEAGEGLPGLVGVEIERIRARFLLASNTPQQRQRVGFDRRAHRWNDSAASLADSRHFSGDPTQLLHGNVFQDADGHYGVEGVVFERQLLSVCLRELKVTEPFELREVDAVTREAVCQRESDEVGAVCAADLEHRRGRRDS